MKLIIFSIPESVFIPTFIDELSNMCQKLGFGTKVNILEEKDLKTTEDTPTNDLKHVLNQLLKCCGDPTNQIVFTANFYRAVSEGFGSTAKDTKIILKEIIKAKTNKEVKKYAEDLNMGFIFGLAERTLGLLR